jgi:hypothetical protein
VKELTGGAFCDRVIEAVGKQWPLDLSAELTRERGRLIIAGYHQDGPRQVNMQLWNWRGLDVINAHERDPEVYLAGIRAAVAAVTSGRLDPRPLYTHVYPARAARRGPRRHPRPAGRLPQSPGDGLMGARRVRASAFWRRLDRPPPHGGDPRDRRRRGRGIADASPEMAAAAAALAPGARLVSTLDELLDSGSTPW